MRGNNSIRILTEEEQHGVREACRVCIYTSEVFMHLYILGALNSYHHEHGSVVPL